ncbi:zinc ribbon domain-containing protein [Promethearchaeum syntrophicum]|uniref:Zinc ribbon domain-containing protein n=1 Tax=Promethearchaeum syntrophicum TaxID=2594042 RepID=A0A5B9DBR0_9ARCH|nr:zinc ribbon domain-containing protein [Candidatus Prometheoarchaeum syntrophicum]QEE16287.1 hypothetical protein DSAG12_02117 [Candidatus Prometheoarchaeum syntrophicum]
MILQTNIYEFLDYAIIGILGLMNFLVFILLIVVGVSNFKKALGPDCKKGFSRFFVAFLVFLMFSTFMDFAYSLTYKIFYIQTVENEFYSVGYFNYIVNTIWGITYGLGVLNKLIAFLLLFSAMEIKLFNKKSKWKFGILTVILLGSIFIMEIVKITLRFTIGGIGSAITTLTVGVLSSLDYIILAIAIRYLLKRTGKENESLKVYTKPIAIGVLFLFNFNSIIQILQYIRGFIDYFFNINSYYDYDELLYWINIGLFFLTSLLFIIGIILLAVGAIKTMSVPLTFSKKKGVKGAPRQAVNKKQNTCPSCNTPLPPGAEFCTNCGNHL